jgi:hypothetical protein
MTRLWYIRILKRGSRFAVRIVNVFDSCEPEDPIQLELVDWADVESLLRALKPVSHVAQIYMDVNGLGALLRTSTLPVQPIDDLVSIAAKELASLSGATGFSTAFLTREEIAKRLHVFQRSWPRKTRPVG